MKHSVLRKSLIFGINFLFLGASLSSGFIVYNILINPLKSNNIGISLISSSPPKEEWNKTYGGAEEDWCYDAQQTTDGGYIMVGYTTSQGSGHEDIWLVKTDMNGIMDWNKTFGSYTQDKGYSVQQTSDGGYILTGKTFSYGSGSCDVWLIKTDQNGNEQWNKTYGNTQADSGRSVRQTSDGGYIIIGITKSYGYGGYDIWLVKTDESGVEIWNYTYGGPFNDEGSSVEIIPDNGYVLTGGINGYTGYDICLIKTDEEGTKEWNKTWIKPGNDIGSCVKVTADGGYIITGHRTDYPNFSDAWLIKTDLNGTMEWNKTFGENGFDFAESVYQTVSGGYIITGATTNKSGLNRDLFLIKTNSNGIKLWNNTIGTKENGEMGYSVQQTIDGGYVVAGYTCSFGEGKSDFWLIKFAGENQKPDAPTIAGPAIVRPGTYDWTFKAIDSEKDDLFYYIDWGDDDTEEWIGPYPSGESVTINHTYRDIGSVVIRSRVKDIYGAESNWTYFEVEIPRSRASSFYLWFFERFLLLERLLELIR